MHARENLIAHVDISLGIQQSLHTLKPPCHTSRECNCWSARSSIAPIAEWEACTRTLSPSVCLCLCLCLILVLGLSHSPSQSQSQSQGYCLGDHAGTEEQKNAARTQAHLPSQQLRVHSCPI